MPPSEPSRPATHLAMWSGPRNISTALMRSFESRGETKVCDEPLYAHYLHATGLPHPMAAEIVERHERDWRLVVAELCAPLEAGTSLYYQKHMAHHLLPTIERGWLEQLEHAFLIRDPQQMLISLHKVTPFPGILDTGLPQQVELYRELRARGQRPPVIDTRDVLEDPRALLTHLCEAVGLDFRESMLSWPAGPRASDGCWAEHWYAQVYQTTGFGRWQAGSEELPEALSEVHDACRELYEELHAERIQAS